MAAPVTITGIEGIPEIRPGDDIGAHIATAAAAQGVSLQDDDVIIVTQKAVSKSEDRFVDLESVEPSPLAIEIAKVGEKDPRHVEVVLRETKRIVRNDRGVLIVETRHGLVCANAGVDASNVPDGQLMLLPVDPDASAQRIRESVPEAHRRRRRRDHLGHLRPALAHRLHGGRHRRRRHEADSRLRRAVGHPRPGAARDLDLHRR